MTTPGIEKDPLGKFKVKGVKNRISDPKLEQFNQLRSAADLLPAETGNRVKSMLEANPLASGGILAGLVENGSLPNNELAKTLIEIDRLTKDKREKELLDQQQRIENEKFQKTLRGRIWSAIKKDVRIPLLVGQTIVEGLSAGARDLANTGEKVHQDIEGAFKGDLDWKTFESKVPGKTREELGYGSGLQWKDYLELLDIPEQITAVQIVKDVIAGKDINVGEGFFVSDEQGSGFKARKAAIEERGVEVKLRDRTYVRPYSVADPVTNLLTAGNAGTDYGTIISALGEVLVSWKLDPLLRISQKKRELDVLKKQAATVSGRKAAKKLTAIANLEAEIKDLSRKTKEAFDSYKITPSATNEEAYNAFIRAMDEEQAANAKYVDLVDTGYDADAIAAYLSSSRGSVVLDWLANASWEDIFFLTRKGTKKGGFTVEQAKALGKATTRDEVLRAIAPYIANGTVIANLLETGTKASRGLAKLAAGTETIAPKVIKTNAARVLKQMPFVSKVAAITNNTMYNTIVKGVNYVRRAYDTVIPSQTAIHFADRDLLVTSIRDYGRIANVSEETIKKILNKYVDSEDLNTAAYDAVTTLMKEIVRANSNKKFLGRDFGIDRAELENITTVFETAKRNMSKYWADRHAAGAELKYMFSDGRKISLSGPHIDSELLNSMFYFPDAKELIRTISLGNKIGALKGAKRGADYLSNVWKKFVLVRPAYVIRNIMEEQIRVFGTGHVSFFNSPLTAMAMWLGRENSSASWRRLLAKMDPFRNTVLDDGWKIGSVADEFSAEIAAHETIAPYLMYIQDNVNGAMERDSVLVKSIRGYDDVRYLPGQSPEARDNFFEAIANEIRMLNNSAAARAVASNMDNPSAAIDYLRNGAGKKEWSRFVNAQNKDVKEFLLSDEGIMMYLYTGKDADGRLISLASRIEEVAGNGGEASYGIKQLIATGKFESSVGSIVAPKANDSAANSIRNAREIAKNNKAIRDINQEFAQTLKTVFDEKGDWSNLLFKRPVGNVETSINADRTVFEWFFDTAVKFEKQTTMGPEWRQKYWDAILDIAPGLDEAAVASLSKVAEKSLSPLVSWTGRPIGKEHPVWKAFKSTKPGGEITKEEAHEYASRVASQHVADLFYDASRKRLLFHQLRLILPFGQAWEDTIRAWTRISLDNPDQVYKVGKSLEWLTSPESGALYNLTDARDIYDPNQGFFFQDRNTGERKLFIPFLGTGLNILTNLATGKSPMAGGPVVLTATPQSFNFAFASGSIMPGVGPGVTFPLSYLDGLGRDPLNLLPAGAREIAEKIIFPFGRPAVSEQGVVETFLLSGNWRRILGGAFAESSFISAFTPTFAYLMRTGDYDLNNPEDQARLTRDATEYARWHTVWRGVLGLVSPAPFQLEALAKDKSGETVLAAALYNDYANLEIKYGGDSNKAHGEFIDLYGPETIFSIIGASTGGPVNGLTYELLRRDPSVLDAYPDVYGYLYPGGGRSQELYNFLKRKNLKEPLDADEIVDKVTAIRYYAARDRVLTRAMAEEWVPERLDSALKNLQEAYVARGLKQVVDVYRDERVMDQLRKATDDPRFQDSDAVDGLRRYLYFRDRALVAAGKELNGTLESKGTINQRQWLAERARDIIKDNPEFYKLFYTFFRRELEVQ